MPGRNDSWGIEVGSNAIKAVRLVRSGSQVQLADYEIVPFKKILTTPNLDVDQAIGEGLEKLLSKHHNIRKSGVVLSVPGNMAFARFAKLPPVETKKIPDIVRFEAVQQIPFPIDQVEWDYQIFHQEISSDIEVGIFAISKERVQKFLGHYRQAGMRVNGITLSPVAMYNAFNYDAAEKGNTSGTIFMDIGTNATDVVIVDEEKIWIRTLPVGGNNFTEALVKSFKLSYSKAEKLKREAATSKYAKQIFQAMRPVFSELAQELQRSLGYYQSINREAQLTKLVGVGSTFRLPNLKKYLKQQLQMEVTCPIAFNKIAGEGSKEADFADHALNLSTAYGLALQGLGMESVSANLLPRKILQTRLWQRKQPWMAAAAACLAVAAILSGARLYTANSSYNQSYNSNHYQIEAIVNKARDFSSQWSQVSQKQDPLGQIKNLISIFGYRNVTADIYKDISSAIASSSSAELLGADYAQIAKVPRDKRKIIHIDSVQIIYVPTYKKQSAASNQGMDMFGPGMGMGMGMQQNQTKSKKANFFGKKFGLDTFWQKKNGDVQASSNTQSKISSENQLTNYGPRLVITIRGTTPYANATQLLHQMVVALSQSSKKGNQPYKTVKVDLRSLETISSLRSANNRGRGRNNPVYGRRANRPDHLNRGQSPQSSELKNTSNPDELLPKDPMSSKDLSYDRRFVVTWTVQLDQPDQVRRMNGQSGHSSKSTGQQARRSSGEEKGKKGGES